MKSFKQYLIEYNNTPWGYTHNFMEMILSTGSFKIPITKNLSEKLFPKRRIFAFHGTDISGLKKLKKIQNKRTAISVYQKRMEYNLNISVETRGGVLAIVEGDVLVEGFSDMFSGVDSAGRRWVSMARIGKVLGVRDTRKMEEEYGSMLSTLFKKYYPTLTPHRGMIFNEQPSNAFLSAYFKMVHKFLLKFSKLEDNRRKELPRDVSAETILSNFRIVDAYFVLYVRKSDMDFSPNSTTTTNKHILNQKILERIRKIWPKAKVLVMNGLSSKVIDAKDFKQKMAKSIYDKVPSVEELR